MSSLMRYQIRHETVYAYGADVVHSHQLLHLIPRPAPYQQCLQHEIQISPASCRRRDEVDAFGNLVTRVEFEQPHRRLEVITHMAVDVHAPPPVIAEETQAWEQTREMLAYRGHWPSRSDLDACRFRHESPYVRVKQVFTDFAADCFAAGTPVLVGAEALMAKIHRELRYAPGETQVGTPLMDVLKHRRGVCQDFAHLMIACLRSLGLAARYVSGYVRLLTPRSQTAAAVTSSNIGASHAWVAVYAPPYGWIELDPTNNVRVGTDHIAVAWGRDFGDVSPLRGVILGGGTHELVVGVEVRLLG
ncbi:MAG: transglutaminase family protein [Steroidobacteraceae bacterium]